MKSLSHRSLRNSTYEWVKKFDLVLDCRVSVFLARIELNSPSIQFAAASKRCVQFNRAAKFAFFSSKNAVFLLP